MKRLSQEKWRRYEFADGYVVCVKNFSRDELAKEERKHGALRKIGQKFIFRTAGGEEDGKADKA